MVYLELRQTCAYVDSSEGETLCDCCGFHRILLIPPRALRGHGTNESRADPCELALGLAFGGVFLEHTPFPRRQAPGSLGALSAYY